MLEIFKNGILNLVELKQVQPFSLLFELKYNNTNINKEFEYLKDSDGRDRKRAERELCFAYYYASYKSPIFNYTNDERLKKSIQYSSLHESFTISKELQLCIDEIEILEEKSIIALTALKAARNMMNNLISHINNIDFNKVDDNGKPLYDITKYSSFIKQLPELNKSLKDLETAVKEESIVGERIKGGSKKGRRED